MRAVDTNILARYYLRDDQAHARRAAKLRLKPPVKVPAA